MLNIVVEVCDVWSYSRETSKRGPPAPDLDVSLKSWGNDRFLSRPLEAENVCGAQHRFDVILASCMKVN